MRALVATIIFLTLGTLTEATARTAVLPFKVYKTGAGQYENVNGRQIAELLQFYTRQSRQLELVGRDSYNRLDKGYFDRIPQSRLPEICSRLGATRLALGSAVTGNDLRFKGLLYHCQTATVQLRTEKVYTGSIYQAVADFSSRLFIFSPSTPAQAVISHNSTVILLDASGRMSADFKLMKKNLLQLLPAYIDSLHRLGFVVLHPSGKNYFLRPTTDTAVIKKLLNSVHPRGTFTNGLPLYKGLQKINSALKSPHRIMLFTGQLPSSDDEQNRSLARVTRMKEKGHQLFILGARGINSKSVEYYSRLARFGDGEYRNVTYYRRLGLADGNFFYINLNGQRVFKTWHPMTDYLNDRQWQQKISSGQASSIDFPVQKGEHIYLEEVIKWVQRTERLGPLGQSEDHSNLQTLMHNVFLKDSNKLNDFVLKKFLIATHDGSFWLSCYKKSTCEKIEKLPPGRMLYFGLQFNRQYYSAEGISNNPNNIFIWNENYSPPELLQRSINQIYKNPYSYSGTDSNQYWFIKGRIIKSNESGQDIRQ